MNEFISVRCGTVHRPYRSFIQVEEIERVIEDGDDTTLIMTSGTTVSCLENFDTVVSKMIGKDYGHCDTCGAACDEQGCTTDRTHQVAIK